MPRLRTDLQPLEGIRTTFYATFGGYKQFVSKRGLRTKVVMKYIRDAQYRLLTDHLSTIEFEEFYRANAFKIGDLTRFTATVKCYTKGFTGEDIDLKLKYPYAIDYTLSDIQDVAKINTEPFKEHRVVIPNLTDLMTMKRMKLGVVQDA